MVLHIFLLSHETYSDGFEGTVKSWSWIDIVILPFYDTYSYVCWVAAQSWTWIDIDHNALHLFLLSHETYSCGFLGAPQKIQET